MKRLLGAVVLGVVWVLVRGIEALDAVVYDPGAEAWQRYEEDGL